MTVWIITNTGYQAAVDLAQRMGTTGAQQYAEARRPGTRLPEGMEISPRWVEWGWVEPAPHPPVGQLTLF